MAGFMGPWPGLAGPRGSRTSCGMVRGLRWALLPAVVSLLHAASHDPGSWAGPVDPALSNALREVPLAALWAFGPGRRGPP